MTLPCKSDGPRCKVSTRSFLVRTRNEPKKPPSGRLIKLSCNQKQLQTPRNSHERISVICFNRLAPRNPLRRSHFQDANGIEVSKKRDAFAALFGRKGCRLHLFAAILIGFRCLFALQMVIGWCFLITKGLNRRTTKKMRYYVACIAWGLTPIQITAAGVGWRVWL